MESNNELKEIDIKYLVLFFDDITKLGHNNFENISLDKKSYKN